MDLNDKFFDPDYIRRNKWCAFHYFTTYCLLNQGRSVRRAESLCIVGPQPESVICNGIGIRGRVPRRVCCGELRWSTTLFKETIPDAIHVTAIFELNSMFHECFEPHYQLHCNPQGTPRILYPLGHVWLILGPPSTL